MLQIDKTLRKVILKFKQQKEKYGWRIERKKEIKKERTEESYFDI